MPDCFAIETHYCEQPLGYEDYAWTAWYADDEPTDTGLDFGYGSTKGKAIAKLLHDFPRDPFNLSTIRQVPGRTLLGVLA